MKTNFQNSQAGVTLLMSVLILAGLTLISVAVGAFAVQQLRASRATVVTEPAIAAAESGGEEGLWAMKRTGTLSTCPSSESVPLGNQSRANDCKSFVAATLSVRAGVPLTFYLYDPNFPDGNGDTDLSQYPYSLMTIKNIAGTNSINIAVSRLDGSNTGISPSNPSPLSAGQTQSINISPVSSGSEGRMQIVVSSSGDNTITVDTFNGATELGMPTYPTVDSTGCSANTSISSCTGTGQEIFSRRINITVPQ